MIKFSNPNVDAFFDYLAANPEWMAFICMVVPFVGLLGWSAVAKPKELKKKSKHVRTRKSVPGNTVTLIRPKDPRDNGSYLDREDDFDFDKITFYYNEFNDKELVKA